MFGFLATLLCGSIIVKEDLCRSSATRNNKSNAIKNGQATYFDEVKSKWRAVQTDEIVYHRKVNDRDEDVGIRTHAIYKCVDHKKEWMDRVANMYAEKNKNSAKENKNRYWKRLPAWDYKDRNGNHLGYAPIDKVNGKPIWSVNSYDGGESYYETYGSETMRWANIIMVDGEKRFDKRIISGEEYYDKYWPYV